ncbi:3',5'-cyclic-AMP phosphodiesterase [Photobacterium damselae]|uniref:3',5'-cyclic-AMP phosphodiesterase n=1 Tax=Photobacterium damselae TaxID=38293 RepID=UPI00083B9796|nr:3',5'-cyclic-AMP phosphodiesterase [Photobacterium damselae]AWK82818.1 3',5'-cyclic-AMP phosphodiesterase [Photobacterium damselae]ELI6448779.1 3',5'-cyclic-AMP phosphodiesterase [Photobacterium damselae]KAB1512213.1 3',5'-cyclic-AMP phosphodiesterase [Photobacterium damselae subsp. damselae]MCG9705757.1 3',5'-cyclic-AMP phosphodiesterase [Photobacterium damselae]MDC4169121.1 3',5'-cyclic-AMP phosphodiesterase [Photobacterium damselae]
MLTYSLPPRQSDSVVLLQITDTHLFANDAGSLLGVATKDSFHAVLAAIDHQARPFDAIIATGDISQDHSTESYQHFAQGIARWQQPCFWLPGNHDYQPSMKAVLPSPQIKPCEQVLLGEHWQMILLDSQVPGVPHGELRAEQLDMLDRALAAHSERHALVLLHHHPLAAGSAWLDQHQLHNADDFWQVLARYPAKVKSVLCGHIHQELDCMRQGVRVLATPSTCIQFLPDSDDFALDSKAPGWRYLELTPQGDVHTQIHRLANDQFAPDLNSAGY